MAIWLPRCFTQSYLALERQRAEKIYRRRIWRFHPVKKEFEVFGHGLSNPWGFDFNDVGQALRVAVLSLIFFILFKEDILLNKVSLTRIHMFTNLLKRLQITIIYQPMVVQGST